MQGCENESAPRLSGFRSLDFIDVAVFRVIYKLYYL